VVVFFFAEVFFAEVFFVAVFVAMLPSLDIDESRCKA
jgi:hypothetical protein